MKRLVLAALLVLPACEAPQSGAFLGYIEGESVLIAAPQPGWITSLNVVRGSQVKNGDALFSLDATREIAARDSAGTGSIPRPGGAKVSVDSNSTQRTPSTPTGVSSLAICT